MRLAEFHFVGRYRTRFRRRSNVIVCLLKLANKVAGVIGSKEFQLECLFMGNAVASAAMYLQHVVSASGQGLLYTRNNLEFGHAYVVIVINCFS